MAFSNELQNIIINATSLDKNAFITTTYADDYSINGNHFLVNRVEEMASSQTNTFLLDLSATKVSNLSVILQPLSIKSESARITANLYEGTDYSGGTSQSIFNVNRNSTNTAKAKFSLGATGTTKGTLIRTHTVFASSLGTVLTFSSNTSSPALTILNTSKNYLIEIINNETSTTNIEFNNSFFEF